eukprot:scaffold278_cov195-Amphora_coffeaeformis.AAC.10
MECCSFGHNVSPSSDDDDSVVDGITDLPGTAMETLLDFLRVAKSLRGLLLPDSSLDTNQVLHSLSKTPTKLEHLDLSGNVSAFDALQRYLSSGKASELETLKLDDWPLSLQSLVNDDDDDDDDDDNDFCFDEGEDVEDNNSAEDSDQHPHPVAELQGLVEVVTLRSIYLNGTWGLDEDSEMAEVLGQFHFNISLEKLHRLATVFPETSVPPLEEEPPQAEENPLGDIDHPPAVSASSIAEATNEQRSVDSVFSVAEATTEQRPVGQDSVTRDHHEREVASGLDRHHQDAGVLEHTLVPPPGNIRGDSSNRHERKLRRGDRVRINESYGDGDFARRVGTISNILRGGTYEIAFDGIGTKNFKKKSFHFLQASL